MNFTLLSPRLAVQKGDFLGSGVPYWPVELAVTAAFLQARQRKVSVIDLFGMSPTTLEERADHYLQGQSIKTLGAARTVQSADVFIVFAISYMSHQEINEIIAYLRGARPEAKIVVLENSQAVTAYALQPLAQDFFTSGANFLLCGEPYFNWDEIENALQGLKTASLPQNMLDAAACVAGRTAQRIIVKHPSYPPPAWELFSLENYWLLPYSHGPKRTRKYLPILTSRGCPYPCDFCVVPTTNNQRWRGRRADEVVLEMIYLRDKFGVDYFQVEDLNPTVQSHRWEDICLKLVALNAKIHFAFVSGTKAETLKVEQIPLFAKAGCYYVSISPESGSASVLKEIGKPFDFDHALKLIEACKKNGIYTQACILVGHPSETEADHRLSCGFIRQMVKAGLSEVAVFIVSSLAGSKIYRNRRIEQHDEGALPSFSPKGRVGYQELKRRRQELIRIFFIEKLKQGPTLWLQGIRALLGIPRTKMENLPLRIVFIFRLLLRKKLPKFRFDQGS